MAQLHIDSLDVGDELGTLEIPVCCDDLMDPNPGGFQCGQCDAHLTTTADRTITHITERSEH